MTPDQGGRSPSPQGSSPTHAYTTLHPRDALISFKAFTATTKPHIRIKSNPIPTSKTPDPSSRSENYHHALGFCRGRGRETRTEGESDSKPLKKTDEPFRRWINTHIWKDPIHHFSLSLSLSLSLSGFNGDSLHFLLLPLPTRTRTRNEELKTASSVDFLFFSIFLF